MNMLRSLGHLEHHLQGQAALAQTQIRLFRSDKKRIRKPRWMPRAPSKLFVLPKHPEISEEERLQYKKLVDNYNVEIKSIQMYFRQEQARIEAEKGKFSENTIHEEENFERQIKAVEEANRQIAERRKVEHEEAFQKRIEDKLKAAKLVDERIQAELEKARERFNKEMNTLQCITSETLDAAIEKALDNESMYNFAITATGQILHEKPETQSG